uniref:Glycosyltransferase n=1 Tax=Panax notoginseng TaxID=44586 RepID=A0A977WM37_9APIA|nr:UGT47 [Panax notoginseng]
MEEQKVKNIVIFPYMAQGHIIPFLALALQIERKGYHITFINTPLNIKNLKQSPPLNSSFRLLEIPFNSSNCSLPPETENNDSIPFSLNLTLLQASVSLKPAFRNLISDLVRGGAPPLSVIADIFFGWTAEVAHEFGIFHTIFSGCGGFGLACYYSVWMNLPHNYTDSVEFTLQDFPEAGRIHRSQLATNVLPADGTDSWSKTLQFMLSSWVDSDGILFNTVEEIDKTGLDYFPRKLSLPVWPIGPIHLSVDTRARSGKKYGISSESCINWLDSKPQNFVLYISFGSQNTISASQMMQLAKALDSIEINFIWVVRPPLEFDINLGFDTEEWLPEGFIKRVEDQNKGLIIVKWAPQVEILSHRAVAAFLSHCGWNSVLESLSRGVPLIGWPMGAEQFYNVKYLEEEVGVCVEVARGTKFEVRSEDIVEKIGIVMRENGKGKEMREKADQLKKMIENGGRDEEGYKGSSVKAMEEFLSVAAFFGKDKVRGEDE